MTARPDRPTTGRAPPGQAPSHAPDWRLVVPDDGGRLESVVETLLTVADGRVGTRGSREEGGPGSDPLVAVAGVYDGGGRPGPHLLEGPSWTRVDDLPVGAGRRILDLRSGVLVRESDDGAVRTVRLSCIARPGTVALRIRAPAGVEPGAPLRTPAGAEAGAVEIADGRWTAWVRGSTGRIDAAARQRHRAEGLRRVIDRVAVYRGGAADAPAAGGRTGVETTLSETPGFDALLAEQRRAWADRWRDGAVTVEGDPDTRLAVRFAQFHLLSSVAEEGEAPVGARGLSGRAYAGHVFWDSDVFVLPFLAATRPAAARAMLEYRVRRLDAARARAAAAGAAGARFPWESATDGSEATPTAWRTPEGEIVPVRTGQHEEHIVADVAWAACTYLAWTGDTALLDGDGRGLLVDTARWWVSRVRVDADGRGHLYGVIGPDEYHEIVDDNAFTNVMARWNLRAAAEWGETTGAVDAAEVGRWRDLAARLVDGYDPATGIYEQFAGYRDLAPLRIAAVADPPVAADVLLGREEIRRTQVIKQPDVLMLHHLVPGEVEPASLGPNLDHYLPRTAHGSSLSPAIHASLLARMGRPEQAEALLRLALRIDLDDLTGTAGGGLHLAAYGGAWQALAVGFLGLRPGEGVLHVAPRPLPPSWEALVVPVRFRGRRVRLRWDGHRLEVTAEGPVTLVPEGRPPRIVDGTESLTGWKAGP